MMISKKQMEMMDSRVAPCRRKMMAAIMHNNGMKLTDVGDAIGVKKARAAGIVGYGERVIIGIVNGRSSSLGPSRLKPSGVHFAFALMCDLDISLMQSVRDLAIAGIDLSELTIKPA